MSNLGRNYSLVLIAGLMAIAIAILPLVAGNEYALRFYTLMMIYVLVALGLNVLVGYAGLVSLGQAGLYAIGAYAGAILTTRLDYGFVTCFLIGSALAGLFGVLLAYPTVRVRGVYLAVVTIAFGIIVEEVAIEWDSLTNSWVGISDVSQPTLLGLALDYKQYFYVVGGVVLIAFVLIANIMNSRFGRAMLASSQSEIAARSLGVNVTLIRTLAFVISAVTAGGAGVLYVFLNRYISPDIFSFSDSIRFLLMVILGGTGTLAGPIVGAGIISYLPELLQQFGEWQKFVYGGLLAIVMYVLPKGIVGTVSQLVGPRTQRRDKASRDLSGGKGLQELLSPETGSEGVCLKVRDLSVRFGGLAALDNVTASVDAGKVCALIGPNGAGKSTLLNAVSGIYGVSHGRIEFLGGDITDLKSYQIARLGLARTFQNTELFAEMTVLENVWVGFHNSYQTGLVSTALRLSKFRAEEVAYRQAARELLGFVGLEGYANEKASNLPLGFQRRLEIVRALALRPKLLLLDEPAAGLTRNEIDELIDLMRTLVAGGVSILVIEHHVDLIMAVAQHVTVLDYGKVIAVGTAQQVQQDPTVIEAYFGSAELLSFGISDTKSKLALEKS